MDKERRKLGARRHRLAKSNRGLEGEAKRRPQERGMNRATLVLFAMAVALLGADRSADSTHIEGQHVRWTADRSVCLDVPASIPYVGNVPFSLPESAGVRYIFAQRRGQSIAQMVIIQSEHMASDNDKYRYLLKPGIDVGGVAFKTNVFAFSNALGKLEQPNTEGVATMRYLTSKGFRVPDQFVAVRYATHDAAGKQEFLVFYMQPADPSSIDLADVGPGDLPVFASVFRAAREQADKVIRMHVCGPS